MLFKRRKRRPGEAEMLAEGVSVLVHFYYARIWFLSDEQAEAV